MSAKDLCEILVENGFVYVMQKGSHVIMQKESDKKTFTVTIPIYKVIKKETLLSLVRQSGLARNLFE